MDVDELETMKQAYKNFIDALNNHIKEKKENEQEWIDWVTAHGGEFDPNYETCGVAVFQCAGHEVRVSKTYKEMDFYIDQFEIKINHIYQVYIQKTTSITVHSYEELENELTKVTIFLKKAKEINNLLSIAGDF